MKLFDPEPKQKNAKKNKGAVSVLLALSMLIPLTIPAFASASSASAEVSEAIEASEPLGASSAASASSTAESSASAEEASEAMEAYEAAETPAAIKHAVYLGVQDYGRVNDKDPGLANFVHRFFVDGEIRSYTVSTGEDELYALQNILNEGYVYDITVESGAVTEASGSRAVIEGRVTELSSDSITVESMDGKERQTVSGISAVYEITVSVGETAAAKKERSDISVGDTVKVYDDTVYLAFVAEPYAPPVKGTPGVKTIKNFLSSAASGAGTALYIYGGGWAWQDETVEGSEKWSNPQTLTIGVPQTWIDFFQRQDENFVYRNDNDQVHDYYSVRNNYNQYGYSGVDCSAFVGWCVYNTLNTRSGEEDQPYYAGKSRTRAYYLEKNGFGTIDNTYTSAADFKPGDIFSMSGHVWICLGTCEDGSMVILHSTPSANRVNGKGGGGAQIASVGRAGSEAQKLARHYMAKYYPAWWKLYTPVNNSFGSYTNRGSNGSGKFSWNILESEDMYSESCRGLADPDGYLNMSAAEILADMFGEPVTVSGTKKPARRQRLY